MLLCRLGFSFDVVAGGCLGCGFLLFCFIIHLFACFKLKKVRKND